MPVDVEEAGDDEVLADAVLSVGSGTRIGADALLDSDLEETSKVFTLEPFRLKGSDVRTVL